MPVPSAPDAVPADLPHLTLAREALDRSGVEREDPGLLGRLAADPATGVLHLVGGRAPVRDGALVLVPPAGPFPPEAVFLGRRLTDAATPAAGRPLVLVARESAPGSSGDGGPTGPAEPTDAPTRDPLAGVAWLGLRDVAAGLSDADTGLFVEAVAIANWHAGHGFCSRCGGRTDTESAGWVRRCRDCSAPHFPRTDPAVIMAVMDDQDRILLGSNAAWPAGTVRVVHRGDGGRFKTGGDRDGCLQVFAGHVVIHHDVLAGYQDAADAPVQGVDAVGGVGVLPADEDRFGFQKRLTEDFQAGSGQGGAGLHDVCHGVGHAQAHRGFDRAVQVDDFCVDTALA